MVPKYRREVFAGVTVLGAGCPFHVGEGGKGLIRRERRETVMQLYDESARTLNESADTQGVVLSRTVLSPLR